MSDEELEALKQRKMRELQKRIAVQGKKTEQVNGQKILDTIFKGRAWEVYNAAQIQFPAQMAEIENLLVRLTLEGKIMEMDGEQLYSLLREMGLPIRLNTTIKVLSKGKTKSLSEKFREKTE